MQLRDLLDPDKIINLAFRAFLVLLALILAPELIEAFCSKLSSLEMFAAVCFLMLLSPAAYFLLRFRQGAPVRHERRGAERIPMLPAAEDPHD